MNWIKTQKSRRLLKKSFQDLMNLRQSTSPRFFTLGADPIAKTYYHQRAATRLRKEDFEVGAFREAADVAKALTSHWQATDPSLVPFAKTCELLAGQFQLPEDTDAEVSQFVYVMY